MAKRRKAQDRRRAHVWPCLPWPTASPQSAHRSSASTTHVSIPGSRVTLSPQSQPTSAPHFPRKRLMNSMQSVARSGTSTVSASRCVCPCHRVATKNDRYRMPLKKGAWTTYSPKPAKSILSTLLPRLRHHHHPSPFSSFCSRQTEPVVSLSLSSHLDD